MAKLFRVPCLHHSGSAAGHIMKDARRLHFPANASALAKDDGIRQIPRQIRPKNPTTHVSIICTHAPSSSDYWTVSLSLYLPLAVCHAEEGLQDRGKDGRSRKGKC